MRQLIRILLGTLIFIAVTNQASLAQAIKIGYVNSAKILQDLPEAQDAQKKIDSYQQKIQDSIDVLTKQYQSKMKEYQQKEGLMTDQAKKTAQQEIVSLEQTFNEYRERKLSRDGELAQLTAKLLDPIKEKVLKVIADFAREKKITFIFDKTEAIQILLYGDIKYDYTNLVIDRLKRGKSEEN